MSVHIDHLHIDHLLSLPFDLVDSEGRFSGESLPLREAQLLRNDWSRRGRRCLVIPASYAHSQLSANEAEMRATASFERSRVRYPNVIFSTHRLHTENPMFFSFLFPAPEWQEKGLVPGGLVVSIDRLDGHEWPDEEVEEFFARTMEES